MSSTPVVVAFLSVCFPQKDPPFPPFSATCQQAYHFYSMCCT